MSTIGSVEIKLIEKPSQQDIDPLQAGLNAFNLAATGDNTGKRFALVARDGDAVVGGTIATIYWGWCYIDLLWVSQDQRGRGLGSRLLADTEAQALAYGIHNVYLDTFSWQALPFYQQRGYSVFGQLEDYPPPHTKYWLRKSLKT